MRYKSVISRSRRSGPRAQISKGRGLRCSVSGDRERKESHAWASELEAKINLLSSASMNQPSRKCRNAFPLEGANKCVEVCRINYWWFSLVLCIWRCFRPGAAGWLCGSQFLFPSVSKSRGTLPDQTALFLYCLTMGASLLPTVARTFQSDATLVFQM